MKSQSAHLFHIIHAYSCTYLGQSQPQFANRGVPTGHVFVPQHGYLLVPMPPQQGIVTQSQATVSAPLLPFGGKHCKVCH